jgi:hypothetical protein
VSCLYSTFVFNFLAGVKKSESYSSPSYFEKVSRLVYEFGLSNKL